MYIPHTTTQSNLFWFRAGLEGRVRVRVGVYFCLNSTTCGLIKCLIDFKRDWGVLRVLVIHESEVKKIVDVYACGPRTPARTYCFPVEPRVVLLRLLLLLLLPKDRSAKRGCSWARPAAPKSQRALEVVPIHTAMETCITP